MKIISITIVRDEADIIESFIRYHLNIVDEMIIFNDGSVDYTTDILNKLCDEDLPIIIINRNNKCLDYVQKMNLLLEKAFIEYNGDIVCILDVDEFIVSDDMNPREVIESINSFAYLKIKSRMYVPTQNDDFNEKFVPKRINNMVDRNFEDYKIILHKDLYHNFNLKLSQYNHNLDFSKDKLDDEIESKISNNITLAHFPLRSEEQIVSKVVVKYTDFISNPDVNPNIGFHKFIYEKLFFKIKDGNWSTGDIISYCCTELFESNGELKLIEKPIHINFCENLDIRYSYVIKPIFNVLGQCVNLSKEINKSGKDKRYEASKLAEFNEEIQSLKNQIEQLNLEIESLNNDVSLRGDVSSDYLLNENKKLLEINYLNGLISEYKDEISVLKNKLYLNKDSNNILNENKKTIKVLKIKNKHQENHIKNLMAEINSLKAKLN